MCGTGAPLDTCTISVITQFGTVVVSCASKTATLTSACGSRPSPYSGSTENVAVVDFVSEVCRGYSETTGSRGCDRLNDGAAVPRWRAHLSVRIRREDGSSSGATEEIGTYYLLSSSAGNITATVQWSGQLRLPITDGCGIPFNPATAPPGWIDVDNLRCLPCGFHASNDNRFGCGLMYSIVDVPCCDAALTHTLNIACAP